MRNWEVSIQTFEIGSSGEYEIMETRTLKELRIVFQLRNTYLGDPSLGSLQFYNLAPVTKNMLTSGKCLCSISTGYSEASKGLIFQGEVTNSYEIRESTDTIQQVWLRDSGRSLVDTIPQLDPFSEPQSPSNLLSKLISGTPNLSGPDYIGNSKQLLDSAVDVDEYVFSGTTQEELDDILSPIDLSWFVEFGRVRVYSSLDPLAGQTSGDLTISRNSGLLTRPTISYTGVTFQHLMNSELQPGRLIDIVPNTVEYDLGNESYVPIDTSRWKVSGLFRVMEAIHRGDTRGDKWRTDVKAYYRN